MAQMRSVLTNEARPRHVTYLQEVADEIPALSNNALLLDPDLRLGDVHASSTGLSIREDCGEPSWCPSGPTILEWRSMKS